MKNKKPEYMWCRLCGSNAIIKIDNAKTYYCSKCLEKNIREQTEVVKMDKVKKAELLIKEIDISKYDQREYIQIVHLIFKEIFNA